MLEKVGSEYCYGEFQYCHGKNDQNVSAKKETQVSVFFNVM